MIDIFQYLPLFLIIRLLLTYNKRKILDFIGLGIGIWFWVEAVKGILQLMGVQASNHAVFMVTGSFDNPGPFGGDNVLNSQDSRYLGLIPEEYIIGLVP